MTAKRDTKAGPKKERPKVKKETLKDLQPKRSESIKGGGADNGATRGAGC